MQIFSTENKIKALNHKRMKNLICQHQIFAPKDSNILIESSFEAFLFVGMEYYETNDRYAIRKTSPFWEIQE
jgi:hypothetical protein